MFSLTERKVVDSKLCSMCLSMGSGASADVLERVSLSIATFPSLTDFRYIYNRCDGVAQLVHTASYSRSKGPRFESRQEHKKNV